MKDGKIKYPEESLGKREVEMATLNADVDVWRIDGRWAKGHVMEREI